MGFQVFKLFVIYYFENQMQIVYEIGPNIFIFMATIRLVDIDNDL